jgi:hypothetical protein
VSGNVQMFVIRDIEIVKNLSYSLWGAQGEILTAEVCEWVGI